MENKTEFKIDNILEILQNLFILEAARAGLPSDEIRTILHIDKKRIGVISKYVKSGKSNQ